MARSENKKSNTLHVLLIEDNRADVTLVTEALRFHGIRFEATVLSDGEQALRYLEDHQNESSDTDVVLLDLNLPRVNGLRILSSLRRTGPWRNMPVIVITSSDSAVDRAAASAVGATSYFRKPLTLDEYMGLGSVVKQVLGVPERKNGEQTGFRHFMQTLAGAET